MISQNQQQYLSKAVEVLNEHGMEINVENILHFTKGSIPESTIQKWLKEQKEEIKMLTPYEFGKETGRLQAAIHPKLEQERIEHLANILGIHGDHRLDFSEGYRNGFAEARITAIEQDGGIDYIPSAEEFENETPPWLPNAAELDEIEEELEYPPAEAAFEDVKIAGMSHQAYQNFLDRGDEIFHY
jgi:hypothetical protein